MADENVDNVDNLVINVDKSVDKSEIGNEVTSIDGMLDGITPEMLAGDKNLARNVGRLREIKKDLERARCREDLVYLCVEVLGYKDLDHDIYREIGEMYTKEGRAERPYTLTLIPRTCMKSSLITIGSVIQDLINNPNMRILITNASLSNATGFLSELKGHLEHGVKFRELFGDLVGDVWTSDEITIKTRTRHTKELTIECGSPEKSKTGNHYDRIIADDLVTETNLKTIESKMSIYKYMQDLFDLLDHPNGVLDIIGTRWDLIDLYSMIMDPERKHLEDFRVFWKPAHYGLLEGAEKEGRLNFPWKLHEKELKKLKRNKTALQYSAQYLNNPIPAEDAPFKPEYFQTYGTLPSVMNVFIACDPATTQGKKSDYSVIMVIGVDYYDNWFLLDAIRDKLLPGPLDSAIVNMAEAHNPKLIGIETLGFQAYVKKNVKDKLAVKNKFYNVFDLKTGNIGKEDRIKTLEPRFRNTADIVKGNATGGGIFFPKSIMFTNTDGVEVDMVLAIKDELYKTTWSSERASGTTKRDLADTLAYFSKFTYKPRENEVDVVARAIQDLDGMSKFEWEQKHSREKIQDKLYNMRKSGFPSEALLGEINDDLEEVYS